ncbi:unnamed protein product [Cercopithifilaria johnstoni]|uniref:Anti-proliferative protein domain-containing protein n=1 Tax=Cercopithifilaria johnstoni TaxID=2874296 RepID=A0A8J2LXI2_9BILA|nr:unnamed protein product [Cercopithifilaria johnstoni]
MYTELKELINFLGIYMHHRIPRRRICLFMENYGNHLAGRFLESWKLEEPKYGERERTLVIKTGNRLNEIFTTIATSIGIVEEDLTACFPSSMLLYCNPGEVSCQMINYAHTITVWTGDVNADINYTPIPDGIAFFCETPAVLHNVLNSNGNILGETSSKNKELKSQRCILLQLVNWLDDSAYDLLRSGFFFENKIPPFLFRYTTKENCSFTARSFAGTRFGSHRSRPDHQAMRRIQHAAAFMAVTNDFYNNQPYANNDFVSTTTPSVPLTSATVPTASVGQRNCDATNSMTTSTNLYSSSSAIETGNDFSSWHYPPAAGDTKVDCAKVPSCDERSSADRNNFHLNYPCHSRTPVVDNYNPYPFETASLSQISYTPSENLENQAHNLESNNSDISELQYNISRMSFADGTTPTSSALAPYHAKKH